MQHYAYSAFGKILKIEDGSGNNVTDAPNIEPHFTFTGREYDSESGLYYYRARYYDSSIGRFLQVDPHPGKLINPLTYINGYIYALNNPIYYTDPSGNSGIPIYGNYCGIDYSSDSPPRNGLDQTCERHDAYSGNLPSSKPDSDINRGQADVDLGVQALGAIPKDFVTRPFESPYTAYASLTIASVMIPLGVAQQIKGRVWKMTGSETVGTIVALPAYASAAFHGITLGVPLLIFKTLGIEEFLNDIF